MINCIIFIASILGFLFLGSILKKPKLQLEINTQYSKISLPLTGNLPSWLNGTLIRNCTVPVFEEGKEKTHYFDGIAMLHSFQIKEGKVSYSSRYLESEAYAKIMDSDTEFQNSIDLRKTKNIQDAAVNVFKYNKSYVALTEIPFPVRFDLETLETLGNFEFDDKLPKKNIFESAHPHYFADSKETYNFLTEYGKTSHYVLYKMTENSSRRETIARIPVEKPGYIHSFAMTENYLILVEFPLVVSPLRLFFGRVSDFASYIRLFNWLPEQGTRFFVVEKKTGKLVLQTQSEALFSFHHANAYEDGNDIVLDLVAHSFAQLKMVFPQSEGSAETTQGLERFRISLKEKKLHHEHILETKVDFPKIPDHLDGKPYRYLYMLNLENNSLLKYDFQESQQTLWKAENISLIEPVFVPSPNGHKEDDGILLTIAHDHKTNTSFLLVLDAKNLKEIARASLPDPFPKSFHGQFFF